MQRMLVGLVIVLTAAVAVLGAVVLSLRDEVARRPLAASAAPPPAAPAIDAERMARLETRLAALQSENAALRQEFGTLRKLLASAPVRDAEPGEDGGIPDGEPRPLPGPLPDRFGEGGEGVEITAEEEAWFLALQSHVQRRQRIEGMTRNVMRRVERLERQGEIPELTPEQAAEVEGVLRRYMVASDDIITAYVREPNEAARALNPEERRDLIQRDQAQLRLQAENSLSALLGAAAARTIADATLTSPFGVRFRNADR